jgi:hypothetical protein
MLLTLKKNEGELGHSRILIGTRGPKYGQHPTAGHRPRVSISRARGSLTDDDAKARRYGPTGHMLPPCGVTATASPNLAPPERRGFFFCAAGFDAIDGMLLDMLAPIARKDYEDRRRLCEAWFAPSCPGRRDPSPVTFSVVAGLFSVRDSLPFMVVPSRCTSS